MSKALSLPAPSLSRWSKGHPERVEVVEGLPMQWYVYILSCANGSYYVGHSRGAPVMLRQTFGVLLLRGWWRD